MRLDTKRNRLSTLHRRIEPVATINAESCDSRPCPPAPDMYMTPKLTRQSVPHPAYMEQQCEVAPTHPDCPGQSIDSTQSIIDMEPNA